MAASLSCCGPWMVFTCRSKLVAVHTKDSRDAFVFDCSSAERNPKKTKEKKSSDDVSSEEAGSDRILAVASSPSGKFLALTDDSKRLIVFRCQPSWCCISSRWVVRRCMSLSFSGTEEELLVADKAGDVYSFSLTELEKEGELRMGHLSMLLAVTTSADNRYIITADRDEKIRVSLLRSPFNIQAFCLGHEEFVSFLHIPSGHPHWLLSGSGDGTVKLWEFHSGLRMQSRDLRKSDDTETEKNVTVSRICSSPDGRYVAVQCERVATLQIFTLDGEEEKKLVPQCELTPPHCPVDVTFDPEGRLWVLMESHDVPLQIYCCEQSSWENQPANADLIRVTEAFRPHWELQDACVSRYANLHKASFDNVGVYMQKKQQRLEQQQTKRTKVSHTTTTKDKK
ncbi:tRNA (guanine-N(7)-)-methyltransferase non-catalytic subunit wdr4 [Gouania willdenowi]|uniref:tRNA (guanine-N(7)-)-methyltransferase non-catalytic subunit WDR4 n=1 Tax=Gouania willdenowi TaxID=441366 RepID=A0A8C5NGZ1_GOUWI|nr:tRNA (guanine-N(7)-)-methyltransferase non-catalytic subunit WDR4 [Gouania willdenowi]